MTLPAGTVTFVLADVEGSSRLWEQHRGDMPVALERLEGLVDELLDAHSGARPVEQGEGDSFVAAFSRATHAVGFALALQRTVAAYPWPGGIGLAVRMGVHTGEALLDSDGLYRGETLNRCGRLRGLAEGGQVLVSAITSDLVLDHMPAGAWLQDLGVHRLRDLARPERVHQLCHAQLANEFPPLASLDRLPTNLPVQLTSFIGRDREMAEISGLLERARMVTLTGSGGAGKTRLAVQVAAEQVGRHRDGVWLADLAPVVDPDLVAAAAATALGLKQLPFEALTETLCTRLAEGEVMLVVDNCEHLVESCRQLSETLLRRCPSLSVLATSREALGVEGEAIYPVPSLPVPTSPEDTACESVRLFTERAAMSRPGFVVTPASAPAVVEVCQRLDGIPLAIELAAARCRLLSPAQIATQLSDRFALLTGGRHSALPRQRTLEASVEWSHNLLAEDERILLRRLSVFAGGWTLEAAEAVCAGEGLDSWRVLDALAGLADKSMVVVDDDGEAVRYRMLETIRHYARQRLADSGEAPAVRDHHLTYFVARAEGAENVLRGPEMLAELARWEREIDNLRAADDWSVESGQHEAGMRLGGPLMEFWYRRHAVEGYHRMCTAVAAPGGDPRVRATALLAAGWPAWNLGLIDEWDPYVDESDGIAQALGDEHLQAIVLNTRGWFALTRADETCVAMLEAAVVQLRDLGDSWWLTDAMWGLALALYARGDVTEATRHAREAYDLATSSGNPMLVARAAEVLAYMTLSKGYFAEADTLLAESIPLSELLEDDLHFTLAGSFRAMLFDHRGDGTAAVELADQALAVARRQQCIFSVANCLQVRGTAEYRNGRGNDAVSTLAEAEPFLTMVGLMWAVAWGKALRAEVTLAAGELDEANTQADEALVLTNTPFGRVARPRCLLAAAKVARACGEPADAEDRAHAALADACASSNPLVAIEALELLAALAVDLGDRAEAARLFGAARARRDTLGYPVPPVERTTIEAAQADARAALGDEAFDAAWAEGESMTLDAAAEYASRGRGGRSRPTFGWSSLTPTEVEVVRLVAQGLRNADVAKRMFVSVPTVKTHLAHVFAKLGVSTRGELTAQAARRQV